MVANITAQAVQALRKATGAGMLDAKKALEEAEGDSERAAQILREKGLAGAMKREDRENTQGAVALALIDNKVGAIVELKCETDFVAKSEAFVEAANKAANELATSGESGLAALAEEIDQLKLTLKENIALGKTARFEAGVDGFVDGYLHVQNGRGVNAVLVSLVGADPEVAHDLSLHIAFAKPEYLSRDQVPADVAEQERKTLETLSRNEGKPEAALPKIIEGRMDGFFKGICLLEQSFVKDEKLRISDLLKGASIIGYSQIVVGG